jgi:hypothetical protein
LSRELRRNATSETPQERLFYSRIEQLWTEEQLDSYLATQPPEMRRTEVYWRRADAQHAFEIRAWKASKKRRRKMLVPETLTASIPENLAGPR